jgi:hypothetical protein
LHAQERDQPDVQAQRAAFTQKLAAVAPQHRFFVDECGITTAMTRRYGRAPEGERVTAAVAGTWRNVTLIAALRPTAVVAPLAFEGATDGVAFARTCSRCWCQPCSPVMWSCGIICSRTRMPR